MLDPEVPMIVEPLEPLLKTKLYAVLPVVTLSAVITPFKVIAPV